MKRDFVVSFEITLANELVTAPVITMSIFPDLFLLPVIVVLVLECMACVQVFRRGRENVHASPTWHRGWGTLPRR